MSSLSTISKPPISSLSPLDKINSNPVSNSQIKPTYFGIKRALEEYIDFLISVISFLMRVILTIF
jgi:hypothetical protein